MMWHKKRQYGAACVSIGNGDLGDKNSHSAGELITTLPADVIQAMIDVSEPVHDVADVKLIVRGTTSHNGGNGMLEEMYAKIIRATPNPETGNASWYVLEADFGGVPFEVTHHPPTATMLPNKINQAAARGAERVALRHIREGRKPPRVAVWGHRHISGWGEEMGTLGVFVPSWQYTGGEFGYRIGLGSHIEPIGGAWFLCRGGELLDWDLELFEPRRGKRWQFTG
jgi:hypothetical protein